MGLMAGTVIGINIFSTRPSLMLDDKGGEERIKAASALSWSYLSVLHRSDQCPAPV
jgi:hypothetical protein